MNPADARTALHRAATALPDAAVVLVARLLALGEPGGPEVLGPVPGAEYDTDPGGARATRPASVGEHRVVAAELWRLLGRGR